MLVSFLIPSRGRPQSLLATLESIISTYSYTHPAEILIAFDEDDAESLNLIETILLKFTDLKNEERGNVLQIKIFTVERMGYHQLHEYYNFLVDKARGHLCWLFNDDAVIIGDKWDIRLENDYQNSKSELIYMRPTEIVTHYDLLSPEYMYENFTNTNPLVPIYNQNRSLSGVKLLQKSAWTNQPLRLFFWNQPKILSNLEISGLAGFPILSKELINLWGNISVCCYNDTFLIHICMPYIDTTCSQIISHGGYKNKALPEEELMPITENIIDYTIPEWHTYLIEGTPPTNAPILQNIINECDIRKTKIIEYMKINNIPYNEELQSYNK